jgi:hypothetical protein
MSGKFDIEGTRKLLANFPVGKSPRRASPVGKQVRAETRYTGPQLGNANSESLAFYAVSFTDPLMSWQYPHRDIRVRKVVNIYEHQATDEPTEPVVTIIHNHKFNEPCAPWNFCYRLGTDPHG